MLAYSGICCLHQSDRLGYVSRTNQSVVFVLWFERCSNFRELTRNSERAVRTMESSFWMRKLGFSVLLTCMLPRFRRNAILRDRWKTLDTSRKRVTHAVKMVDSCSRENGILCTVARLSLWFLHEESAWKNFESNIARGMINCIKHFDLNSSWTVSCVARFMICWVWRLHFSGLVCSVLYLYMYVWLKLTMDDSVYVFDA